MPSVMAAVMAQILLSSWAKCTRSRPKRWENVSSFLPLAGAAWFFGPIPWNSSGAFLRRRKALPLHRFHMEKHRPVHRSGIAEQTGEALHIMAVYRAHVLNPMFSNMLQGRRLALMASLILWIPWWMTRPGGVARIIFR